MQTTRRVGQAAQKLTTEREEGAGREEERGGKREGEQGEGREKV